MSTNPRIWFVDDLGSNLDEFVEAHKDSFQIRTFACPDATAAGRGVQAGADGDLPVFLSQFKGDEESCRGSGILRCADLCCGHGVLLLCC